jgi:hypothetical protein
MIPNLPNRTVWVHNPVFDKVRGSISLNPVGEGSCDARTVLGVNAQHPEFGILVQALRWEAPRAVESGTDIQHLVRIGLQIRGGAKFG